MRQLHFLAFLCTLLLAGCLDPHSPAPAVTLRIEGTVISSSTGQPISGAEVIVTYSSPVTGGSGLLDRDTTDADGAFTLRVEELPGYAFPNCYLMSVRVSAAGYKDQSRVGEWGELSIPGDPTCETGKAVLHFRMIPAG